MTTTKSSQTEKAKELRQFFEKVVVNAGIGRASTQQPNFEEKILPQIVRDLAMIAGQRPQVTRARKSIAGFKLRQGQVVGVRATLHGRKMVDFFERMITIILPRTRDFSGLDSKAIDARGSLNLGFREQFVFPEIDAEHSPFVFSLGVNIVPKGKNRAAAVEAYRRLGVPLKKENR